MADCNDAEPGQCAPWELVDRMMTSGEHFGFPQAGRTVPGEGKALCARSNTPAATILGAGLSPRRYRADDPGKPVRAGPVIETDEQALQSAVEASGSWLRAHHRRGV